MGEEVIDADHRDGGSGWIGDAACFGGWGEGKRDGRGYKGTFFPGLRGEKLVFCCYTKDVTLTRLRLLLQNGTYKKRMW